MQRLVLYPPRRPSPSKVRVVRVAARASWIWTSRRHHLTALGRRDLDGANGQSTMQQGNTTFQFGSQRSFDQRYNTNNLFDPYAREGR